MTELETIPGIPIAFHNTIAVTWQHDHVFQAGRPGGPQVTIDSKAKEGPSPALRPLLDLGFRIADRDQFMASEPGLIDPARLIPNPGML